MLHGGRTLWPKTSSHSPGATADGLPAGSRRLRTTNPRATPAPCARRGFGDRGRCLGHTRWRFPCCRSSFAVATHEHSLSTSKHQAPRTASPSFGASCASLHRKSGYVERPRNHRMRPSTPWKRALAPASEHAWCLKELGLPESLLAAQRSARESGKRRRIAGGQLAAHASYSVHRERIETVSCALPNDSTRGCNDLAPAHAVPKRAPCAREGARSPRSEFPVPVKELAVQATASQRDDTSCRCREASLSRAEAATRLREGRPSARKRIHACKEGASRACDRGRIGGDFASRGKTTFRTHKTRPGCVARSLHGARSRFAVQQRGGAAHGSAVVCTGRRHDEREASSRCTEALSRRCEARNEDSTLLSGVRERAQRLRKRLADTGSSLAVQCSGSGFSSALPAVASTSSTTSMTSTGTTASTIASAAVDRAGLQSAGASRRCDLAHDNWVLARDLGVEPPLCISALAPHVVRGSGA